MLVIIALLVAGYIVISFGVITFACMFSSRMSSERYEIDSREKIAQSGDEEDHSNRYGGGTKQSRFSTSNVRFIE
jgi:hypothetical protein